MSWSYAEHVFEKLSQPLDTYDELRMKSELQGVANHLIRHNYRPNPRETTKRDSYPPYFNMIGEEVDRAKRLDKEVLNFIKTFDREELKNANHTSNKFIKFVIEYLALLCPDSMENIMSFGYIPERVMTSYNIENLNMNTYSNDTVELQKYVFDSYVRLFEQLLDKTTHDEANHLINQLEEVNGLDLSGITYEDILREKSPELWKHFMNLEDGVKNVLIDQNPVMNAFVYVLDAFYDSLKTEPSELDNTNLKTIAGPSEMDLKFIRRGMVENRSNRKPFDNVESPPFYTLNFDEMNKNA